MLKQVKKRIKQQEKLNDDPREVLWRANETSTRSFTNSFKKFVMEVIQMIPFMNVQMNG